MADLMNNNPTETFQNAIIDAVKTAAQENVHPAIVYTVLHGVAGDVIFSIKQANRQAAGTASGPAAPPTPPANVVELSKTDSAN